MGSGTLLPCWARECPKPILMPENEIVWGIVMHLMSQARVGGMGGFVGFDYGALPMLLEAYDIPKNHWQFLLDDIRMVGEIASKFFNAKKEDG